MNYLVKYAMSCNIGKVRKYNQDNFWCNGRFLEEVNRGINEIRRGILAANERPVFAVFDGMGGEQKGEVASYIAASALDEFLKSNSAELSTDILVSLFRHINSNVCSYGDKEGIKNVGSTGSLLAFTSDSVLLCNIGDSPILHFHNGNLSQVSEDHVLDVGRKKAPLTQFLGVPLDEFIIEPYTVSLGLCDKDRYLICSDGITDMIEREEIERIMAEEQDVAECTRHLLCSALDNGGVDNITLIVMEINKVKPFAKII